MMCTKLIKNQETIDKDKITLFCIPFAGGGASSYNQWIKRMQDIFNVCPIQLPGREDRIAEQPYKDMRVMLNDLERAVKNVVRGPYAFWGHSMGGKIDYELEKRMEECGYTAKCIFVSSSKVPHIPEPDPIYHLPNAEFKERLARFEGTPQELLHDQKLLDFFLPMLRADFMLDETYYSNSVKRLQCPIVAFGGDTDGEVSMEEMEEWKMYTENYFEIQIFCGGHFYIREHEDDVIQAVMKQLGKYLHEN